MKAYQDASLAPARRAKALLEEMTLAEKVSSISVFTDFGFMSENA